MMVLERPKLGTCTHGCGSCRQGASREAGSRGEKESNALRTSPGFNVLPRLPEARMLGCAG